MWLFEGVYKAKRGHAVCVVTQHHAVYAKKLISCDRGRRASTEHYCFPSL